MDDTAPIACSLSAPEYRQRAREAACLAQHALRTRQPVAGGARLTFAGSPQVRERPESLVAAEAACCPFLTLHLAREDGDLILTVTGPAGAAPIVDALFARC